MKTTANNDEHHDLLRPVIANAVENSQNQMDATSYVYSREQVKGGGWLLTFSVRRNITFCFVEDGTYLPTVVHLVGKE
ncbi:hypothetical protein I3760_06G032100 [Carya illinoinensis]|nr:hypothetical protein I3760_06G032100 [Carya illinoinensis]